MDNLPQQIAALNSATREFCNKPWALQHDDDRRRLVDWSNEIMDHLIRELEDRVAKSGMGIWVDAGRILGKVAEWEDQGGNGWDRSDKIEPLFLALQKVGGC